MRKKQEFYTVIKRDWGRVRHIMENGWARATLTSLQKLKSILRSNKVFKLSKQLEYLCVKYDKLTLNIWGRSCSGCSRPGWLFSSVCVMSSGSTGSGGSGELVTKSSSMFSSSSSVKSSRSNDLRDNGNPLANNVCGRSLAQAKYCIHHNGWYVKASSFYNKMQ